METERITLSQRERDRLKVLHEVQQKQLTQVAAAERLKVSDRHVRRMLLGLRERGDRSLVHGLRGRPSNRKLATRWEQKILARLRQRYADFGPTLNSVCVAESVCPCTLKIGPCKNAAAYRTVLLADAEGKQAMKLLQEFIGARLANSNELVFPSPQNTALRATNVLREALHPVLEVLGLPKAGLHAFRHGTNRRWELAGMNPACQRQQMGHSSATMTALYTGEIPLAQVRAAFSRMKGNKIDVLENVENESAACAVA